MSVSETDSALVAETVKVCSKNIYVIPNNMSDENMEQELERLRKENAALKKGGSKGLSLRVSQKGAVSLYGMGRFPVTLYKEQWLKVLDMADEIRQFIQDNEGQLKTK